VLVVGFDLDGLAQVGAGGVVEASGWGGGLVFFGGGGKGRGGTYNWAMAGLVPVRDSRVVFWGGEEGVCWMGEAEAEAKVARARRVRVGMCMVAAVVGGWGMSWRW
jgi:hypothetical protein